MVVFVVVFASAIFVTLHQRMSTFQIMLWSPSKLLKHLMAYYSEETTASSLPHSSTDRKLRTKARLAKEVTKVCLYHLSVSLSVLLRRESLVLSLRRRAVSVERERERENLFLSSVRQDQRCVRVSILRLSNEKLLIESPQQTERD